MFENLRRDSEKYADLGGWFSNAGFWIIAIYRFGVWADGLPGLLRLPFWIVYRILHLPYFFFNIQLWAGARGSKIGPGVCLIHPNNLYFGPGTVVGADSLIHHEVTLGQGNIPGCPQLGDNVTLYPGARILGGVRIGSGSMIGANCVVLRHVGPDTIVMPPANRNLPRSLSLKAREMDSQAAGLTGPGDLNA